MRNMRFDLLLTVISKERGTVLPINYQYELSSWIYKVLNEGDPVFSEWLHENGYKTNDKPFKLFTFSNLIIPLYKVDNDRINILSDKITLIISFLPDEAIEPFILGLFKDRRLIVGDKKSQVAFEISQVTGLPPLSFERKMIFRTISPIFVDEYDLQRDSSKHLSPEDKNYSNIIHNNLIEKYRAFYNKEPDLAWPVTKIKVLGNPKSKMVEIKTGTAQVTKIRAFNFKFEIEGSKELIEVGYFGGFGRLGSQGFGCVE